MHISTRSHAPTFSIRCSYLVEIVETDADGNEHARYKVHQRPVSQEYIDPSIMEDAIEARKGFAEGLRGDIGLPGEDPFIDLIPDNGIDVLITPMGVTIGAKTPDMPSLEDPF